MIPIEVYIEQLKHQLASQKSVYDYLQLLLPIITAFIGWFSAYFLNKSEFKNQVKKESIEQLEKLIDRIISLENDLKSYVNNSINEILMRHSEKIRMSDSFFQIFYCEADNKYNYISKLLKIHFSEFSHNYENVINEIRNIEKQLTIYNSLLDVKKERELAEMSKIFSIYSRMFQCINTNEENMIKILDNRRKGKKSNS